MRKLNQVIAIFILMSFCACVEQADNKSEIQVGREIEEGWVLLEEPNYSIQYPEDWNLNQSKQMGTEFFLLSKLTGPEDKFSENVNLMIQDLSAQDMSFDEYIELSENQIKEMVTEYELLTSERIKKMEDDEYHKFLYNGQQGENMLTIEQYAWMVNKKAYILTFTSLEEEYESYKVLGEKILDSFIIKE